MEVIYDLRFSRCKSLPSASFNVDLKLSQFDRKAFSQSGLMLIHIPCFLEVIFERSISGCPSLLSVSFDPDSKLCPTLLDLLTGLHRDCSSSLDR
jgi:hypothetical protein